MFVAHIRFLESRRHHLEDDTLYLSRIYKVKETFVDQLNRCIFFNTLYDTAFEKISE